MRFLVQIACVAAVALASLAGQAQTPPAAVEIERHRLGSGEPGLQGFENATLVINDLYHAPQYLPGYPTAAAIWARVVNVACVRVEAGGLRCNGYNWQPGLGRGEYLFFRPVVVESPAPA